jgi:phosphoglycerate dehydrogenase-like enzyme
MAWRVVATGPWEEPGWQALLEEAGCEVVMGKSFDQFPGPVYSDDDFIELLTDADAALVSTRDRITRRVLENLPRLKIVAKATIGVENIDLAAAADVGILVINSPAPENFIGIAEATVGQILALTKQLMRSQQRIRDGKWKSRDDLGSLLMGRTIGIVGLGRVGSNVARRLDPWGVRLLAVDPYVEPAQAYAVGAELVRLEEMLPIADVVSLHVVLTDETRYMIDEPQLRAMKPTAYLVNTSRGPAVRTSALVRAIEQNWIAGAALDVFEDEPLGIDSPLRRLDPNRVILTPHCIGNNVASHLTGVRMVQENILLALEGQVPRYVKNPEAIKLWRERFALAGVR